MAQYHEATQTQCRTCAIGLIAHDSCSQCERCCQCKVNLHNTVAGWYALQDLMYLPYTPFRHSHERLRRDVHETFAAYTRDLAALLYDYLCLAAWGEARHAHTYADAIIADISEGGSRQSAQAEAKAYDPEQFLPKLHALFDGADWDSSYGGGKWAVIVDAARLYRHMPHEVFIDHAIDLSHNGGLAFDKGCLLYCTPPDMYRAMLDRKRAGSVFDGKTLKLPRQVYDLAMRAMRLELFMPDAVLMSRRPFRYTPIAWGEEHVSDMEAHERYSWCCKSCDNGYTDDEICCSHCESCEHCCECWTCEKCWEKYGDDDYPCLECSRCESCCQCWTCDGCDQTYGKYDYRCDRCEQCEHCCSCVACDACNERMETYACDECQTCADCCEGHEPEDTPETDETADNAQIPLFEEE